MDDARDVLSGLFTEVSVEPLSARMPYGALVNGLELTRSAVCCCEYPHGMVAGPLAPLDFHAIQLTLSGAARFHIARSSVDGDTTKGVMLSAGERVRVHHAEDNSILSFIVKDEVMREALTLWTGEPISARLEFRQQFDPSEPRTASLLSLLKTFASELNRPGGVLESPATVASFEHTLMTSMLFGFEHNFSDRLRMPSAPAGADQVRQVEEYIEAHATEPIDMDSLSRATGHSASSIYRAFRRHRSYSPMQFLREERMSRARQRLLLAQPPESVTRVAVQSGFTHFGRFAMDYKHRFGESPSDTLQRSLRAPTGRSSISK